MRIWTSTIQSIQSPPQCIFQLSAAYFAERGVRMPHPHEHPTCLPSGDYRRRRHWATSRSFLATSLIWPSRSASHHSEYYSWSLAVLVHDSYGGSGAWYHYQRRSVYRAFHQDRSPDDDSDESYTNPNHTRTPFENTISIWGALQPMRSTPQYFPTQTSPRTLAHQPLRTPSS